jgi:uncharacterized membrane protein
MIQTRFLQGLTRRHALVAGIGVGLVALAAAFLIPSGLLTSTRCVAAWDLGVLVFFGALFFIVRSMSVPDLRDYAERLQGGRNAVLIGASLAGAAALVTVFLEMKLAKGEHGLEQAARIVLVIATVAVSWLFVQTIFALDYAHEYYTHEGADDREGLKFPGGEPPDFWDFLHFAITIGVAAQTADIMIESKRLRRLVTIQALIAFSFNAVILALAINLTAGLV